MIGKELFLNLFEPGQIGKVRLRNRIVWLPIGSYFCGSNSDVTERSIADFVERAKGGVGLITVGVTNVTPMDDQPIIKKHFNLAEGRLLHGHYHLTEAVHLHGAKIAIQLFQVGDIVFSGASSGKQPLSPSGIQQYFMDGRPFASPRPMSRSEIYQMIEYFVTAGANAKRCGYDAVELHAAHGYLLSAFLSPALNKRTDEFGGSLENRARMVAEIIKGIHQLVGDDYPVIVRINADDLLPGGMTIKESPAMAKILEEAGAAAISVSSGTYANGVDMDGAMNMREGWKLPFWVAIKAAVTIPTIAGGGIRKPAFCEKLLAERYADFIGLGRPLIADPYWPQKVMEGRREDINNCISCMRCVLATSGFPHVTHCTVNAMWGREVDYVDRKPPALKKTVLVVGGGVAGMEAARAASLRGHEVTLYEKGQQLGGQLLIASICEFLGKNKLRWIRGYLKTQLKKQGVRIKLGSEVTPNIVDKVKPDVVIIATGAQPRLPNIPSIKSAKVVTAWDILAGKQKIANQNVVILGGKMIGSETACFLARQQNKVTIIEKHLTIAEDVEPYNRQVLLNDLREQKVKTLTGLEVVEFTDSGVDVINIASGNKKSVKADMVVVALDVSPVRNLAEALEDKVNEMYMIGDCQEPRAIQEAIGDGFLIGNNI